MTRLLTVATRLQPRLQRSFSVHLDRRSRFVLFRVPPLGNGRRFNLTLDKETMEDPDEFAYRSAPRRVVLSTDGIEEAPNGSEKGIVAGSETASRF
jgi:hypothetical protein